MFIIVVAIAIATLAVLAAWPLLRRLANAIANLHFERTAVRNARNARAGGAPVRVRQTDLVGRMQAEDRAKFREAERLLSVGQVADAAVLFEAIKFQRRAIDELEKAKLIDEAAGVLLRMNVPARAAVIFERNGRLPEAAKYFMQAGQFESAGSTYLKLAKRNYGLYELAGAAFLQANKPASAIQAFGTALQTPRVVAIAKEHKAHEHLASYIADRSTANEVLATMSVEHRDAFFAELEMTPRHVRLVAQWLQLASARPYAKAILERTAREEGMPAHFWAAMQPVERAELFSALRALGLPPELVSQHSIAVERLDRAAAAGHVAKLRA